MPFVFSPADSAPTAKKEPLTLSQLGRERTDDYAWMKDQNWQAVMKDPSKLDQNIRRHLEAENAYTQSVLSELAPLQEQLFEEMKGRLDPVDQDVPQADGQFAYYHRFRTGDQYGCYARIAIDEHRNPAGDEEITLDADALAGPDKGFFNLGSVSHSPDHQYLAYAVDRAGSEYFEIFVKPIGGEPRSTGITQSTGSLIWAADSKTIFWVEHDDNHRPSKVFARRVDAADDSAQLVYEESDPGYFVSVEKSESDRFIFINTHNHTTSEIWVVPADDPFASAACFSARQDGREYSLHDHGEEFYILTNAEGATDFQIMRRAIAADSDTPWQEWITHEHGALILGLEAYSGHLVRLVRENALPRIIIRNMTTGKDKAIEFDEEAYSLGLMGSLEFDTPWMRFVYASPTTPSQVFDYNMETGERVLKKTQNVPSGHEPSEYKTERLHITARDGETIPVTLLYRSNIEHDGQSPLLLYGYGSYGLTESARFRTAVLSLIDRGFVYAIAHIRGGMAKGYQWYLDGKLEKKTNTFNDFVDVGRVLAQKQYTSRGKIVCLGGSAGGLLVGAALNQDPDLFGGVIGAVPFVDVLNTMSDETLPLTPPEWPEWGNPLIDAEAYDRIAAYSPYDNIDRRSYPPVLITGGLTDPRVTYWEPAKWAAKLRDHQTGDAPILLKINMEAGHQGESGRYDSLKEVALEYAFALAAVNLA